VPAGTRRDGDGAAPTTGPDGRVDGGAPPVADRSIPADPPLLDRPAPTATFGIPQPDAPPRPGSPAGARSRRRLVVLVAAVVAVLAVGGALLGLWLGQRDPGDGSAAPQTTSQPAPGPVTSAPDVTSQPGPSRTEPPATTSAEPSPTAQPNPPADAGTPAKAVSDYYALMPGNLEEGFARLTPSYQNSPGGGFAGYQRFWNRMSSVAVSAVTATGDNVVTATVQYNFKDGEVVRENHTYWLVQQDGRWLIDRSTVDSSVTL
jgi:hypothetical protein